MEARPASLGPLHRFRQGPPSQRQGAGWRKVQKWESE